MPAPATAPAGNADTMPPRPQPSAAAAPPRPMGHPTSNPYARQGYPMPPQPWFVNPGNPYGQPPPGWGGVVNRPR